MGRAARWLRGLLAGKWGGADDKPAKEKRKWGLVKSLREREVPVPVPVPVPATATAAATAGVLEERRGLYREGARRPPAVAVDEEEQSKRAIAVAAATAAVAEAAVAAAQAAAEVVRLTSSGRSVVGGFGGAKWAAVKIQAAFRGYLARRALRALKGLVKLQALVRGNIVRKQAAETLRCMHALVRVQARARACRAIHSERSNCSKKCSRHHHPGPPTPEKHEPAIRANAPKSSTPKRNSSKPPINTDTANSNRAHTSGWNWLDRWMEERYWENRESSKAAMDDEKNAKILEIDTWKPQLNTKRRSSNHQHSSCSTLTSDHNSRGFPTLPDSPSKDSTAAQQSNPSPSSVGDFAESPQFYSASSRPGSSRRGPFTPVKSECARSVFSGYSDYPNYMANTESSKAKVRSQSAPKQRPEFEKLGSFKRLSAHGFCRDPSAVMTAQRSSFANKGYPGSGRLDRMGMPIRYQ